MAANGEETSRTSAGYRPPRQSDIARIAGVSQSAVSLILSGKYGDRGITEDTRQRVLEIAESMGYRANSAARRLRGQSSRLLGVHSYGDIFPLGFQNYNYEYLVGAHLAAEQSGFDVVLFTSTRRDAAPSPYVGGEENRLSVADGSVIVGGRADEHDLQRLANEGYPFVHVGRREVAGVDIAWVGSDYASGTRHMVEQLVAAGHDRLMYLGIESDAESKVDRRDGFAQAVAALGMTSPVATMPREAITREWLAVVHAQGVRTIVAEDHDMANRTVTAATSMGLRLRSDLAIAVLAPPLVGEFDSWFCGFLIEQREEIGWRAGRLVVDLIEGREPESRHVMIQCRASVTTYGFVPD